MATRTSRRDHHRLEGGTPRQAYLKDRRERAQIRRRRRRAASLLTLVPGLVFALALMWAPGAPAVHGPTIDFVVNTTEDVVPSFDGDAAKLTEDEYKYAIAACLGDDSTYKGAFDVRGALTGPQDTVHGADDRVNDEADRAQNDEPDTVPNEPEVPSVALSNPDAVHQCSLRMAILAAGALTPSHRLLGSTTLNGQNEHAFGPVTIEIGSPVADPDAPNVDVGDTFKLGPTDHEDTSIVGPTVDAPGPLPPIVGGSITIEGCAMEPEPKGPCVNLDLDAQPVLDPAGVGPQTSSLPESAPGLVAAADQTTIKGIAFQGGTGAEYTPAILAAPTSTTVRSENLLALPDHLTVESSWFGLEVDDNGAGIFATAPEVAIQLSGMFARIENNTFTGGEGSGKPGRNGMGDVGVLISGGFESEVIGNQFGTDATGAPATNSRGLEPTLRTGIMLAGVGANASEVLPDNEAAYTTLAEDNAINGNVIVNTEKFGVDVGGEPMEANAGVANGEPVGVTGTTINSNWIGVTKTGQAAENEEAGIVVRNGSRGTTIGEAGAGNVISNNKGPGVLVQESFEPGVHGTGVVTGGAAFEEGARSPTTIRFNVGSDNGKAGLIDLGDPGLGNDPDGALGGLQAPAITGTDATTASGTAPSGSTVDVYLVPEGGKRGDVASHLATATADGGGQWTAQFGAETAGERTITAAATTSGGDTSELAAVATVPEFVPPKPKIIEQPAAPPADVNPPQITTILGQSVEDGGQIKVKRAPKRIEGELADESGIAEVLVALEVVKLKKKGKKGKRKGSSRKAKQLRAKTAGKRGKKCNKIKNAKKAKKCKKAKKKGKGKKGKGKKCKYVHPRKGKILKRKCAEPPFKPADIETKASGAEWEMPLSKKARKRMKPGRYLLHVRTVDTEGNAETHSVPMKVKKKFKAKKGKGKKGKRGKRSR